MDHKICPKCDAENQPGARVCAGCGAVFTSEINYYATQEVRTVEEIQTEPEINHREQVRELGRMYKDAFIFFPKGSNVPIIVERTDYKTILGRGEAVNIAPTVDLTDVGGDTLGVSRNHACVYRADKKFLIEDMNSTNGTWVNGDPLLPYAPTLLKSGDYIQLGQLILYVYITATGHDTIPFPKKGMRPSRNQ